PERHRRSLLEFPCELCLYVRVCPGLTPYAEHYVVAHRLESLQVKSRVEATADEADAQAVLHGFSVLITYAELGERFRRAALPLGDEGVADVAQILHADATREEPRGGQVAERVEERHSSGVLWLGLAWPRDVVQHGGALRLTAPQKGLPVTFFGFVV